MLRKPITIGLIAWACATVADYKAADGPYNYYSSNALVPRPWFAQFEAWYPHNAKVLIEISTGIYNLTLRDYRVEFAAPRDSANATKLLSTCYRHEACIVDQVATNHQLNYQSALVMLGLVPTLLACIGPSIAEISLLYAHRPVLSALLSLSMPTIWTVSSLFEANTPNHARITTMGRLVPRQLKPRFTAALSICEYLLAAGTATNAIFTALEVGQKTILAWGCTTQFAPFLWAVIPSVVYAIAGANYYYLMAKKRTDVTRKSFAIDSSRTGHFLKRLFDATRRRLSREATVCANLKGIWLRSRARVPVIARLLDIGIGIMGFIHFVFGIAVFSSLQFVTVLDTFRKIIFRFALSTFICRVIVIVELAGLAVPDDSVEFGLRFSEPAPYRPFPARN